ncbi:MAG: 4Fe-4S dicluster domain-containing protein [Vicinamibacterales bacterium]|jgi:electron-transferring-flavoprotein dehydrogenase|nr:4Fe-4S dicluster domain-containing protein [Vicinamibacterales bacterium]
MKAARPSRNGPSCDCSSPLRPFCPTNVYEMMSDGDGGGAGHRLHIATSNWVDCRTCDIMDPYQVINWVPPGDGAGPEYGGM